jgi:hypothetical protein
MAKEFTLKDIPDHTRGRTISPPPIILPKEKFQKPKENTESNSGGK